MEAYLGSPHSTEDLIELVQFIFRHEAVPDDMAVGEFIMLWKGKGGTDDLIQYRAVCLEEVGLKLTASIMLARLSVEVGESHGASKTQEGSRKGKERKVPIETGFCQPDRTQERKIPSENSGQVPKGTVN